MTDPPTTPEDDPIVDAIVSVWVLDGVAAVTHRRVAEAAGVSKGKLQHAYPTGVDLIAAGVSRLIPPPAGPGLLWGHLEFYVHARLWPSSDITVFDPPSLIDLARVEAYVWAARHAA